jgi:large subunit ribosomal protein L22
MLSKQIAGLPIDEAIVQMRYSQKKAATWIRHELVQARDAAVFGEDAKRDRLIVGESHFSQLLGVEI